MKAVSNIVFVAIGLVLVFTPAAVASQGTYPVQPYPGVAWTAQIGTPARDQSNSVAVDGSDNIYITGWTEGDLGEPNAGEGDAFLVKFDTLGNELWSRQVGTVSTDESRSVAVDGSGNVYITGYTQGDLAGPNAGLSDAFLVKYDSLGNQIWSQQIGTSGMEYSYSVAVDGSGNAYITGDTYGDLDGTNAGYSDIYLVKFDSSGNQLWAKQIGTPRRDYGRSVAVDASGNAFITGWTEGSLGGTNAGEADPFLAKFDSSGNQLWLKQLGTSNYDFSTAVAVDSSGNAYISGDTYGSLARPLSGYYKDAFLVKFSSSGNKLWAKQIGTSKHDRSNSVAVDCFDNVYIAGYTQGNLAGTNAGNYDAFVVKFDSSGKQLWSQQIGSSGLDDSKSLAVNSYGNVCITGWTYGSLGGPNAGDYDAFLIKFAVPVAGRNIFYNNSAFDGNDPAANASDDAAIATDKAALLPGETASFANYTSFSRGINGIMIDIETFAATPTANDFAFRVGNHSNPSLWSPLAVIPGISVRTGAGAGGSDRITITFADGAITGEWLEVTYLPSTDVFYFGNAIGETGNSITDAMVTIADESVVRGNPHSLRINPAEIDDACDFNRDKKVGPTDSIIARNNGTNSSTTLKLIRVNNTAPVVLAGPDATITLPASAALDGRVTDDGLPDPPANVTTAWSMISGPGTVTFSDANAVDTTAAFSFYGTYVLRLTADDSDFTRYDDVTIAAEPDPGTNYAPIVFAGFDMSFYLPAGTSLYGTVTDDGLPDPPNMVTTTWEKISGAGTVTFSAPAALDTTAYFSDADTYVIRLTADDGVLSSYDELTVIANAEPECSNAYQESGGMIVMEAESMCDNDTFSSSAPWRYGEEKTGYVGYAYMYASSAGAAATWDTGRKLSYEIDFVTAGAYSVWMHVNTDGEANNNCFIGMDGTALPEFGSDTFGSWHWHNEGQTIDVTAGRHTFEIVGKEEYFSVDRIILTRDASFTPTGTGPAESARETPGRYHSH